MAKSVKWLAPRGPERWLQGRRQKEWNEAVERWNADLEVRAWRTIADRWVSVAMVLTMCAPSALANYQALLEKYDGRDLTHEKALAVQLWGELAFLLVLGESLGLDGAEEEVSTEVMIAALKAVANGWWALENQARIMRGEEAVPGWALWTHPLTTQMLQKAIAVHVALRDQARLRRVVGSDSPEIESAPARRM